MTAPADPFGAPLSPIHLVDGHLPIEDHGLVGDGTTAALVGRDGSIPWMCIPRFDSPPVFCSILDRDRGGHLTLAPRRALASRQHYEPSSAILVTDIRAETGTVRIVDAMLLRDGSDLSDDMRAGRSELLRSVTVLDGSVELEIEVLPRGGATLRPRAGGWELAMPQRPDLDLQLATSHPLEGPRTSLRLDHGDCFDLTLKWEGSAHRHSRQRGRDPLDPTRRSWRRWSGRLEYAGPEAALVERSAITLKLLDDLATGALLAAPTSSLPEQVGGVRNWDYRYAWVRDTAFSVYALRRIGFGEEAWGFLGWVLDVLARRGGEPGVLFTTDGEDPPAEREDPVLRGHRGSAPVRWGNGASDQTQHDAYGEIVDCAYQWAAGGGRLDDVGPALCELIREAGERWNRPDHGIWEVRTPGDVYTYSAAMCQVALDRGARLAERSLLSGPAQRWRAAAETVRQAILDEAWDEGLGAITGTLAGSSALDASVLALPLRRVVEASHPKMVSTVEAVARELGAGGGLLYRYDPGELPDGLEGTEGAFLLCSFWMADNLIHQGRVEEGGQLYESLCSRANPLGLLPEQIDPSSGRFLGNFPQAFSHVGVISTGINLQRHLGVDVEVDR